MRTNVKKKCSCFLHRYTCRGLFERHKLLFSFQMCAKILEAAQKLNIDEYQFFLKGGVVSCPNIFSQSTIYKLSDAA